MSLAPRIARWLTAAPLALACIALFFLMCMTFVDVVLRSAADAPIRAATELTRISVAIIVFASPPHLSARNEHIAVDLLDCWFKPGRVSQVRDALIALFCAACLWWPAERIVVLAERARSFGDFTEYLSIPTFYITWFIAVATYLTMGALAARGLALLVAPSLVTDFEKGDAA